MPKDYIECCYCGFIGLVEAGVDMCPFCNEKGYLAWVRVEPGICPRCKNTEIDKNAKY